MSYGYTHIYTQYENLIIAFYTSLIEKCLHVLDTLPGYSSKAFRNRLLLIIIRIITHSHSQNPVWVTDENKNQNSETAMSSITTVLLY